MDGPGFADALIALDIQKNFAEAAVGAQIGIVIGARPAVWIFKSPTVNAMP